MSATFMRAHGIMRLTRDPQMVPNTKTPVLNLSLATNYKYRRQDGTVVDEPPSYIEAEAYNLTATTIAKGAKKGDRLYLEGRLRLDTWEDKGSGSKRSAMKLVVQKFNFIDARAVDKPEADEAVQEE